MRIMKKLKNFVYGIKKAYAVRFGIEMAYGIVSKKPLETLDNDEFLDILSFLKAASDIHKEAFNLCPKWIVKLIVGYGVD